MHLISAITVGITTNLDNLIVGASFASTKKHISFLYDIIIAVVSAVASVAACIIASNLSFLGKVAEPLGSAIIISLGIRSFVSETIKIRRKRETATEYENISLRKALVLSLLLAVDCFAGSVGATLSGVPMYMTVTSVFVFSVALIILGAAIGERFSRNSTGRTLTFIAAGAMIALGIAELHLR